jgi:hypothetical protein
VFRADNFITFMCPLSINSGSLNLLETSGPVQACIVIALPCVYYLYSSHMISNRRRSSKDKTAADWRLQRRRGKGRLLLCMLHVHHKYKTVFYGGVLFHIRSPYVLLPPSADHIQFLAQSTNTETHRSKTSRQPTNSCPAIYNVKAVCETFNSF